MRTSAVTIFIFYIAIFTLCVRSCLFYIGPFEVKFIDKCFTFAYDKEYLLSSCFLLACIECTPYIIWECNCNIHFISALYILFIPQHWTISGLSMYTFDIK